MRFFWGWLFGFVCGAASIVGLGFAVQTFSGKDGVQQAVVPGLPAITREGTAFAEAKKAIGELLFDPYSAQYEGLEIKSTSLGEFVCGQVNAKNKMGGYVGRQPFIYSTATKIPIVVTGKKDAFVYSTYLRECFPNYPIPGDAREANAPD